MVDAGYNIGAQIVDMQKTFLDGDSSTHLRARELAGWSQWYDSPEHSGTRPPPSQYLQSNETQSHHRRHATTLPEISDRHHRTVTTQGPDSAWHQWHNNSMQSGTSPNSPPPSQPGQHNETQSHHRRHATVLPEILDGHRRTVTTQGPDSAWDQWHNSPKHSGASLDSPSPPQQSNEAQLHHRRYATVLPPSSIWHHAVTTETPGYAWYRWHNGSSHLQQSGLGPYDPPEHLRPETQSYRHLRLPTPQPSLNHNSSLTHPRTTDPSSVRPEWRNTPAYPRRSVPSPYIPHQPLNPETQPRNDPGSINLRPNSRPEISNIPYIVVLPSEDDLSPPDLQASTPGARMVASRDTHRKRPQQWRHDFKFKSGLASMFRRVSNTVRTLNGGVDSAKLDLHPFLCYSKSDSITMYNLRRKPDTLTLRELDHTLAANHMEHSATQPATQHMRIYHPRLPWYIDVSANGDPYISIKNFFQQLFASLNTPVSNEELYNDELDDEDRRVLTYTCFDRCRSEGEEMDGVKRIDFLRDKFEWKGLVAGKKGMWCLKTS